MGDPIVEETKGQQEIDSPTVSDNESAGYSISEKSLLRKLDARLLPAVGILYLLSFLDRSNGKYTSHDFVTYKDSQFSL